MQSLVAEAFRATCRPAPATILHLLILGHLLHHCACYHWHHHIYEEGEAEDACTSADFDSSYWTAPGGRGSQLLGTQHAQRVIWDHQHPASCAGARFLVYHPCNHGIGSTWHVLGQALAHAIAMDRVLVLAADGAHAFYDAAWCGADATYHDCYFLPVSSCTLADAEAAAGGAAAMAQTPHVLKPSADVAGARVVRMACGPEDPHALPAALTDFPEAAAISADKLYYWWRAQSAAYLFRPNERTLAELRALKLEVYPQGQVPRGCISVHIRRGDKWTEVGDESDAKFVSTAEALFAAGGQTFGLTRHIFLSTEDPAAVEYFQRLPDWNVSYTHVARKPDKHKSTMEYAREIGPAREMLNSLVRVGCLAAPCCWAVPSWGFRACMQHCWQAVTLALMRPLQVNLDLALGCDGWVGTATSNWVRLIDELRSTVRCKAHKLYRDAQQGDPPTNLEWR